MNIRRRINPIFVTICAAAAILLFVSMPLAFCATVSTANTSANATLAANSSATPAAPTNATLNTTANATLAAIQNASANDTANATATLVASDANNTTQDLSNTGYMATATPMPVPTRSQSPGFGLVLAVICLAGVSLAIVRLKKR